MKAKGVIRDVVEWKNARGYFYWRAKRRLAEEELGSKLQAVHPLPELPHSCRSALSPQYHQWLTRSCQVHSDTQWSMHFLQMMLVHLFADLSVLGVWLISGCVRSSCPQMFSTGPCKPNNPQGRGRVPALLVAVFVGLRDRWAARISQVGPIVPGQRSDTPLEMGSRAFNWGGGRGVNRAPQNWGGGGGLGKGLN